MAEVIGAASGVLTLGTFAFQASIGLGNIIESFQSHTTRVRELKEELEALSQVLQSLNERASAGTDDDFSGLKLPLLRCGRACKDFEKEIHKCSSRSGGSRTSFRDWAKLRYMGEDIDGFRRLLSGYKATINIALTDASLRQSAVHAETLEEYKGLIENVTGDLEDRLQSIDEKLETLCDSSASQSDADAAELRLIKEERLSTQKCLQICAQLSEHIDQIQLTAESEDGSHGEMDPDAIPERLTNNGLQECKESLAITAAKLERHMGDLIDRLVLKSNRAANSEEDRVDILRLRDEWSTTRQCIDICSKADAHLKGNMMVIENYGAGDAAQFMVSTNGQAFRGKNRGVGWKSRQFGGFMSDATVRAISRDYSSVRLQQTAGESAPPHGGTTSSPNEPNIEVGPGFKRQYGPGYKLTPDTTESTAGSVRDL